LLQRKIDGQADEGRWCPETTPRASPRARRSQDDFRVGRILRLARPDLVPELLVVVAFKLGCDDRQA
jgi:hypothetical protein